MKFRPSHCVVVAVAGIVLTTFGTLFAVEPNKDRQPAQPQYTPSATYELELAANAFLSGNALSFAAHTHANPLGIEVAPVDKALGAQLGLAENNGVVVTAVPAGSEAAKAGLAV